ncbi:MAG: hypothetical protein HF962_01825 [Sulfurovum sp.]|nr:hypothetical protein [Sulfurovum sp.]
MQKYIPLLVLIIIVSYAIYNSQLKTEIKKVSPVANQYLDHKNKHSTIDIQEELSVIDTDEYLKQYIIDVIVHGSVGLRFNKDEIMEGGFASKEDAPKIACYTMELAGRKCQEAYPDDAALFYTSVCGGCHGNDGKGINGAYPDLTLEKMLGISKRKEWLRSKVAQ